MIRAEVFEDQGQIRRFLISGHAGFARVGNDIVCAAVSALVYNAINSCEQLLNIVLDVEDRGDKVICKVPERVLNSSDVQLLLHSMVFGIEQTADSYPKFVKIRRHTAAVNTEFKE